MTNQILKSLFVIKFYLNIFQFQEANNARQHLDGKMALSKKLSVKWAHSDKEVSILITIMNITHPEVFKVL